jgi:hypothetical protein
MKTFILLIGCLSVGVSFAQLPARRAIGGDAEALVRRALQADRELRLTGTRLTEVFMEGEVMRIEERFWKLGERAMRTEVIAPVSRRGEVFLLTGGRWVHFRQGEKRLKPIPPVLEERDAILQRMIRATRQGMMEMSVKGREQVMNRPAALVEIRSTGQARPNASAPPPVGRIQLWIDRETGLVLRKELYAPNGNMRIRVTLMRFELNPPIAEDLFKLPEGMEPESPVRGRFESVEDAQKVVPFKILQPQILPGEAKIQGVFVMPFMDKRIVGIRYVGDRGAFTFFQVKGVDKDFDPPIAQRVPPGERAHFWQQGDYWFGLIGTLSLADMERVEKSIR